MQQPTAHQHAMTCYQAARSCNVAAAATHAHSTCSRIAQIPSPLPPLLPPPQAGGAGRGPPDCRGRVPEEVVCQPPGAQLGGAPQVTLIVNVGDAKAGAIACGGGGHCGAAMRQSGCTDGIPRLAQPMPPSPPNPLRSCPSAPRPCRGQPPGLCPTHPSSTQNCPSATCGSGAAPDAHEQRLAHSALRARPRPLRARHQALRARPCAAPSCASCRTPPRTMQSML